MKPKCKLIGENGNVFNLIALVRRTLNKHKLYEQAKEFTNKVTQAGSYNEALNIMGEYVEIE